MSISLAIILKNSWVWARQDRHYEGGVRGRLALGKSVKHGVLDEFVACQKEFFFVNKCTKPLYHQTTLLRTDSYTIKRLCSELIENQLWAKSFCLHGQTFIETKRLWLKQNVTRAQRASDSVSPKVALSIQSKKSTQFFQANGYKSSEIPLLVACLWPRSLFRIGKIWSG